VRLSFEAGDIVGEVMSFGSPTPVEVAVDGKDFAETRRYAEKVREQLDRLCLKPGESVAGAGPGKPLRELHYAQSRNDPTLEVQGDRERAGLSGVTRADVGKALAPATLSSRFTAPNYWRDPASGIAFQVQVEIPAARMDSAEAVATVPIKRTPDGQVLVRD